MAIVTAAGQGIGKAIAKSFAEAGATVAVVDIDAEAADNVADEISNGGGLAYALAVDVTKSNKVDAMVNEVVARSGRIDILVNGVGGWRRICPITEISDEEWLSLLQLNLTSAFYCSRAAARIA